MTELKEQLAPTADSIAQAPKNQEQKPELTEAEMIALAVKALAKNNEKKETQSIEFKYVFQEKTPGQFLHWDYKKDGQVLFKWNKEYWQEQSEELIKEQIAAWLRESTHSNSQARI